MYSTLWPATGDPLDALVLVDEPIFLACLIIARPVAAHRLRDEAGDDAKRLCVPVGQPAWEQAHDPDDLPRPLPDEIAHCFAVYKTLESGKGTTANGWDDRATAVQELQEARRRGRPDLIDDVTTNPARASTRRTGGRRSRLGRGPTPRPRSRRVSWG